MSAHKYELMFIADPATSDELDRVLNLNESVIRTKILRKG